MSVPNNIHFLGGRGKGVINIVVLLFPCAAAGASLPGPAPLCLARTSGSASPSAGERKAVVECHERRCVLPTGTWPVFVTFVWGDGKMIR